MLKHADTEGREISAPANVQLFPAPTDVDSFRLHMRINQLQSDGQVFGETGALTLNELGQIERTLSLAKILRGVAVMDAPSTPAQAED